MLTESKELRKIKAKYGNKEKDKVWAFCAGQYSNDFRGNPKYLFIYINEYRQDINAYWLCDDERVIELVHSLGYEAYRLGTIEAETVINYTGVLVAEQVKMVIPAGLENAKYLNLWHGVGGVKPVERSLTTGRLAEEIAKKYIKNNVYYRTHELYLAPSAFIEGIAREQLGLDQNQIIRAGYPRCIYQSHYRKISTFEHDIIKQRELPEDTRIVAYTPTYRNNQGGELFTKAIPDIEKLISVCEEQHLLMVFKMHPLLEKENGFLKTKEAYQDCQWCYFWDNNEDFYEILDKVDCCIMDYSSIFTDFIAVGVKHFLRYTFDFNSIEFDFPLDYDEATVGRKCNNFEELLAALADYEKDDIKEDIKRIGNLYWEYADENSLDRIVDYTVAFKPLEKTFPILYSFDIFDTLISRKVLAPIGIFYYVKEKMIASTQKWPDYLVENYPFIRSNAEANVREYYNRSIVERDDERCEIQFEEILNRIQVIYGISDEQKVLLGQWEMEAELENVIPLTERINYVKQLVAEGEDVVLISDMYLPKDFILQMLSKADPILAEIPLYLSSEYGYQKSRKSLYMEVYRHYGTEYSFKRWIHTGDNDHSDRKMARALNIETVLVEKTEFNKFEEALTERAQSYDGYLIAASLARFRAEHISKKAYFAYAYISMLFVPYVHWALNASVADGNEIAYFISRDGHQLKRIADAIIAEENLNIETKYIYASRRTWRIPSFFDHIDIGFWGKGYGNLAKVSSFSSLLKALDISEDDFREMFPELSYLNGTNPIDEEENIHLISIIKNSLKYEKYLLQKAQEERVPACGYLAQEMEPEKSFSIIEYWGRGYTQENFTRLWQNIVKKEVATTFYYSRSTLPSDEYNIRKNYTSHPSSQAFIESIFSCINYKTIEGYWRKNGKWLPVTAPNNCDLELFHAMETYLPTFAKQFCTLPLRNRDKLGRTLIDFAITWHAEHKDWEYFTEVLAKQKDSVEMYGSRTEYAPRLTMDSLNQVMEGKRRNQISKSIVMSYYRSSEDVKSRYRDMFQVRENEDLSLGWKISDDEINRNKVARDNLVKQMRLNDEFEKLYSEECSTNKVGSNVLLLSDNKSFEIMEYSSLLSCLEAQNRLHVMTIALGSTKLNRQQLAREIAISKYVIVPHPLALLSDLKLRNETKLIVLGDTAIQYFKNTMASKRKLRDEQDLAALKLKNDITYVQCASQAAFEREKIKYQLSGDARPLVIGNCFTDCYFDEDIKSKIRKKLYLAFPEAEYKKIICYIPYYRVRNAKSKYAQMLNMQELQKALSNDYVVIMNLMSNAKEMSNIIENNEFSMDASKILSVREQMMIADIIIADYRDTSFDAAIFDVPVFVTCNDYEKFDIGQVFCSFHEMLFGVPINDTWELITQIKNIENYDDTNQRKFKEKYLTYCDGHAAERLVKFIIDREIKSEGLSETIENKENLYIPSRYIEKKSVAHEGTIHLRLTEDVIKKTPVLLWDNYQGAEEYELAITDESQNNIQKVCIISESKRYYYVPESKMDCYFIIRPISNTDSFIGEWSAPFKIPTDYNNEFSKVLRENISAPKIIGCTKDIKGGIRIYWDGNENAAAWKIYRKHDGEVKNIYELPNLCTWEWADALGDWRSEDIYYVSAVYKDHGALIESDLSAGYATKDILKERPIVTRHIPEGLRIKWLRQEGTEYYRIYRKDGIRAKYHLVQEIFDPEITTYVDSTIHSGVVRYIIQSYTTNGMLATAPLRLDLEEPLQKPSGLQIVSISQNDIELLWDSAENISGWNIRRCTVDNPKGEKIAEVPGIFNWWRDKNVTNDTIGYRIEAFKYTSKFTMYSGYCKIQYVPITIS